LKLATLNVR